MARQSGRRARAVGGFKVRKAGDRFAVSQGGAVLSLHPTREDAETMAATLTRHAAPKPKPRKRNAPDRP